MGPGSGGAAVQGMWAERVLGPLCTLKTPAGQMERAGPGRQGEPSGGRPRESSTQMGLARSPREWALWYCPGIPDPG